MLKLCRFSIIVLHLLLLSHFVHTFVLLTASVDDVKKIAQKFVSDELAEKIADFIARATESFAQSKTSDENIRDNSEVSAENRMYNIERQAHESVDKKKPKEENIGKEKVHHSSKKKKQAEIEDTKTTSKPKKERKIKSRYIVEVDKKDSTEKELPKPSAEEKYNKRQESIKHIEDNMLSVTEKTKNKQQNKKKKVNPYKLLSNFDSDENNGKRSGIFTSKDNKDTEAFMAHRAFDNGIATIKKGATKKTIEKVPNKYEHTETHEKAPARIEIKKTPEKEPLPATNEPHKYVSEITKKTEKVTATGLKSENIVKEKKWWEEDLPELDVDEAKNRKTWF